MAFLQVKMKTPFFLHIICYEIITIQLVCEVSLIMHLKLLAKRRK